jgi:hypothetical protein
MIASPASWSPSQPNLSFETVLTALTATMNVPMIVKKRKYAAAIIFLQISLRGKGTAGNQLN